MLLCTDIFDFTYRTHLLQLSDFVTTTFVYTACLFNHRFSFELRWFVRVSSFPSAADSSRFSRIFRVNVAVVEARSLRRQVSVVVCFLCCILGVVVVCAECKLECRM